MSEVQFPNRRPHGFQRRGTDRRIEPPEQCAVLGASNQTGPKAIPEEVKLNVRILAFAFPVFAVDDLGFRRMHFQVAFRQAGLKLCLEGLRFLLVPAVYQSVIRIPTPREVGVRPRHPEIERIMQEQVSQNRADNAPLRGTTRPLNLHTVCVFHWRRQPPFDVEQRPFTRYVLPDSPQQEFMVDIIKQTFDIELQDPIIFPAPFTRNAHGIKRRFLRPVAIGVCQEYLVQIRLNELFDNHLSDSISYSWHDCVELHLGPANLWDLRR